jgi:hypothetical protein
VKLQCSAGHKWDSEKVSDQWWKGPKKPGDRCGEELRYDRVGGLIRCRRVLRKVDSPNETSPSTAGKETAF